MGVLWDEKDKKNNPLSKHQITWNLDQHKCTPEEAKQKECAVQKHEECLKSVAEAEKNKEDPQAKMVKMDKAQ